MKREIILILGGARSGKSRFAQQLATELGERVLFLATAKPLDEEMRHRIAHHRRARPSQWRTLEASSGIAQAIREHCGDAEVVILDCLSLLVANLMSPTHDPTELERVDYGTVEKEVSAELERVIALTEALPLRLIIVSNEVGMGLVPVYPVGRAYRDLLGRANQFIAQRADRVYLVIAGIPLQLKGDHICDLGD